MKRIKAEWDSYHLAVLPPGVSLVQLLETKRAFYAGALACFAILTNLSDDDELTADDLSKVQDAQAELLQWQLEQDPRVKASN